MYLYTVKRIVISIFLVIMCVNMGMTTTVCPRGTYLPNIHSRTCNKCPPGRYAVSAGKTICDGVCPAGKYGPRPGGISEDDCDLCPPGTFGQIPGLATEKCSGRCPAGRYSTNPGQSSLGACLPCPSGYFEGDCVENPYNRDFLPPRQKRQS